MTQLLNKMSFTFIQIYKNHHPTVGWHPGGVVTKVMPGLLIRVVLICNGDHSPNVDLSPYDRPVTLRVVNGIAARFLQVSAEVDTRADHPIFRLVETWFYRWLQRCSLWCHGTWRTFYHLLVLRGPDDLHQGAHQSHLQPIGTAGRCQYCCRSEVYYCLDFI